MTSETPINGRRLRTARKAVPLSQLQLARRCDTQQSHISAIERGQRGASVECLAQIAAELGVSIAWLCERSDTVAPEPGATTADSVEADEASPRGLVELASDPRLVDAVGITSAEWVALRTLCPPVPLTKDCYLAMLLTMRGGRRLKDSRT